MIGLGTLSSLGYGPLGFVKILGMQFLDLFDFLTNSVMMPIAAFVTSLLVSRVVGIDKIEEEIRHGESKFRCECIWLDINVKRKYDDERSQTDDCGTCFRVNQR